jgi:hypothetical protein
MATVAPTSNPHSEEDNVLSEKTDSLNRESQQGTKSGDETAQQVTEGNKILDTTTEKGKETTEVLKESQEGAATVVKIPFEHPLPQCTPKRHNEISEEQKQKYDDVLRAVEAWTEIPTNSAKNSDKSPLNDEERMWLTKDCILRYLRATKWNVSQAITRLQQTLTWKREYGVYEFTAEYIEPEQLTGKQIILGYDNDGRPCHYMDPSKQNTKESDRQLHHLVYMLDAAIALMPPGQETIALIIDYKDSTSAKNPSISTGKKTLNILQSHYPERLGRALISEGKLGFI